jgi:hypothetical protein
MTAIGSDPLNPTTLFNPFKKMWNTSHWLWPCVWHTFFQNIKYELLLRPKYKRSYRDRGLKL